MPVVLKQSDVAKGIIGMPYPSEAGDVCAKRATIALTVAPVADDIFEMLMIPAGCRPIDIILDSDDLDTGTPAIAFDVGIMSGTPGKADITRTVGSEFMAASTVGYAGTVARPTLKTAFRVAKSDTERAIGLKCTTAAATFAAGTIGLTLIYAAGD